MTAKPSNQTVSPSQTAPSSPEEDRRVLSDRRSGTDRRLSSQDAGLQIDQGIARFNGDRQIYQHILRSYAANIPPLLETLKTVTPDTLASYAITIHGIKGASRGICAEQTGNGAEALETAAKKGDFPFVFLHNTAFVNAVEALLTTIEDYLNKEAPQTPKPVKAKPDNQLLTQLLNACAHYDMDSVDAAMVALESFHYDSDEGLALWLRENVNRMNFADIQEKLNAVIHPT